MQAARAKALDAAAAAGVITQDQADWMGSRGFGRGGMMNGYGYGMAPARCSTAMEFPVDGPAVWSPARG